MVRHFSRGNIDHFDTAVVAGDDVQCLASERRMLLGRPVASGIVSTICPLASSKTMTVS